MTPTDLAPIVYEYGFDTLYNDLDPYNHLNSSRYLDYVVSSRNLYLRHVLHTTLDDFKERGFGVFMRKATTEFLKPVLPHERIHIRSWVREVRNTSFFIEFEMLSGDQKDVHARGELLIVWMDLATGKPCGFPDWAHRYFFKPLPA